MPVVSAYKGKEHRPSFTDRDIISTGALGGYQGDFSTSTLPRWPVWHRHLSPKTCMSHSTQGVAQSVNQSEALDFVKWLLHFLNHLHRRYMASTLWSNYISRWESTGNKSQPSWRSRPLVEEETQKFTWVRVIQADWMRASWTSSKGSGTSIIQQRDGENLWQKLQQIDHE